VHENSGHFGLAKLTAELAKRVYFPGWKSLSAIILKNCDVCSRFRRGEAPKQTPLRPMLAARPMDVLQVDLVGPLIEGKKSNGQRGFYYILTVIDVYSKFLFTAPLKNKTTEVVAEAMVDIFMRVGLSSSWASDNGLEFQSKLMRDVNRILGIHQLRSTSERPSTQGCCERSHRTLHALFAKHVGEKQKWWPDTLAQITLMYNLSVHSATSYTPYFLFHGREGICSLDLITHIPDDQTPSDIHEYALQLTEKLRYAAELVQKVTKTRIERMKKSYDSKIKPKTFETGQFVYYYYPRHRNNRYHKWQFNYIGVFKVIKVINSTNCILQRTPRSKAFVAHFDKLKAYNGPTPTAWIGHHETGGKVEMRPTVDTGLTGADSSGTHSSPRPTNPTKRRDRAVATATGGDDNFSDSESDNDANARPKRTIVPPARYRD